MRSHNPIQPSFPWPTPPRTVRHAPIVRPTRESEALHAAVLCLRQAGIPVYRAGADHKVGDRVVDTSQLVALAAAQRRQGKPQSARRARTALPT